MHTVTIDNAMQLGLQHHQAGRLAEAEQLYRLVLRQVPQHPDAMHLLGMLARRAGQLDLAADLIGSAIAINPGSTDYHGNFGLVQMERGKLEESIAALERAIELRPDFAAAYCNLGSALEKLGRTDQAIDAFESAIRIHPRFAEAHSNLGSLFSKQKSFDAAIPALKTAVELSPGFDELHYNLGHALRQSGLLDEAIDSFSHAIELNPRNLTARCNLGNTLREQGKYDAAISQYVQTIAIDPNYAEAHWNLSLTCLSVGDFQRGWAEHEWRTQCESLFKPAVYDKPRWNGEPLNGRTILLHPEQGFGDVLQFVRYAPLVAARGGRVILQCQPELRRLLKNLPGMSSVISVGDPLPVFDLHCPLMSLPFVFQTTLDSIPAELPYLHADESIVNAWNEKLGAHDQFRVGLVWAGSSAHKNDHNRSLPLSVLSSLFNISCIGFFSLQKGAGAEQIAACQFGSMLIDYTSELRDFADTAGLIANLDLVITVDTAVAHLAGATGKPVWLLLPHDPDWRWMLNRDDSPWYPTMRLFRQKQAGDWKSVVSEIGTHLAKSVGIAA